MDAPRALRVYRGPDDPSPFMGIINVLSFQCRNMANNMAPGCIQTLSRVLPNGKVTVMRVGAMGNSLYGMEFVETEGIIGQTIIILNTYNSSIIKIFGLDGTLLRTVDPGVIGSIVSADKETFHLYSFTDHHTISYYSKYNYSGIKTYGITFDAGVVNYARGHNAYDVISGWIYPDPIEPGGNTQWLYLYKNMEYVGGVSFVCTDAHRTEITSAVITDTGVYLTVMDGDITGGVWTNVVEYILYYNLEMVYQGQVMNTPDSLYVLGYIEASNNFTVYSYDLGKYAWAFKSDLSVPFKFTIQYQLDHPDAIYHTPLGVIGNTYYYWFRNNIIDHKVTIVSYDLLNGGIYKGMVELSAGEGTLEPGQMAENVAL